MIRLAAFLALAGVGLFVSAASALSPAVEQKWTCPYDGTEFRSFLVGSPGSLDNGLDLEPYFSRSPFWVRASCPTNGFVFYKDSFDHEELERLRPLILSESFQALRRDTPHFRMAYILAQTGASLEDVASALLKATRANIDPVDYKRYAAALLERFPALLERGRNPDEQAILRALRTELLRRSGRLDEAGASARELLATSEEGTLLHMIGGFQRDLIARGIDGVERIPSQFRERSKPSSFFLSQLIPKSASGTTRLGKFEMQFAGGSLRWSLDGRTLAASKGLRNSLFNFAGEPSRHFDLPFEYGPILAALPNGHWLFAPNDSRGRQNAANRAVGNLSNRIVELDGNYAIANEFVLVDGLNVWLGSASTRQGTSVAFASLRFDAVAGRPTPIVMPDNLPIILAGDSSRPRLLLFLPSGGAQGRLLLWDYELARELWSVPIDETSIRERSRKLPSMALDEKLNEAERQSVLFRRMPTNFYAPELWSGALMADGKRAVVAVSFGDNDSAVMSFDLDSGTFLGARRGWGRWSRVSISDRDGLIAFANGRTLSFLDRDLEEIETIRANDSLISNVAFSPDGARIAISVDGYVSVFRVNR
jgi:hypothetical protein